MLLQLKNIIATRSQSRLQSTTACNLLALHREKSALYELNDPFATKLISVMQTSNKCSRFQIL